MRKLLSLPEFRDYYKTLSFTKFIYATENQPWDSIDITASAKLEFNEMVIAFNPNTVYLRNNKKNVLCFNCVKAVRIDRGVSPIGMAFTLICDTLATKSGEIEHKIIAQ